MKVFWKTVGDYFYLIVAQSAEEAERMLSSLYIWSEGNEDESRLITPPFKVFRTVGRTGLQELDMSEPMVVEADSMMSFNDGH